MRLWAAGVVEQVAAVRDAAAGGRPGLLVVEGAAGMGKTSLLDEVVRGATRFRVLTAEGLEGLRFPFAVLAQWGADVPRPPGGGVVDPFVAAQSLRTLIGSGDRRPVLLRLDDLHWADPESVEAVVWLLQRASGDRLLVAVASRPLPDEMHPGWQRWLAGRADVTRIVLSGLSIDDAVTLVRRRRPETTVEVARLLWEHTSGNPLYLTALIDQYEPGQLLAMRVLPAPDKFVGVIRQRLQRLSPDARNLLDAVAVLGTGWVPLLEAAAVGGVPAPAAAADELTGAAFLRSRTLDPAKPVQVVHPLVRSAIYQAMSAAERQSLHARAAVVVTGEAAMLEHRMAAADRYDEFVADALDAYGRRLYEEKSFRQAAQFLRWAGVLTPQPLLREQRWLDGLFASFFGSDDRAVVHRELDAVHRATDRGRRTLILGSLAVFERRRDDGIVLLTPLAQSPLDSTEPVIRYRIEIVLAWALMVSGAATPTVIDGLERARGLGVHDAGVAGLAVLTEGQATVRVRGVVASLDSVAGLPDRAASVPLAHTDRLAWRGTLRARLGLHPEAIDDLTETAHRIETGVTRLGVGTFHALLACCQWFTGAWPAARLNIRLATDIAGGEDHPVNLAIASLVDSADGAFADADRRLARAVTHLRREPWPEVCQQVVTSLVVRAHAGGSTAERAVLLGRLRGWGFAPPLLEWKDPVLLVHGALAALWAREVDRAAEMVEQALTTRPLSTWVETSAHWVSGLIAEARGRGRTALDQLAAATAGPADGPEDLSLYRAHAYADHARLAHLLGDRGAGQTSLRRAANLYQRLGAWPFLDQVTALNTPGDGHRPAPRPTFTLTEREQDVLALAVGGMTYAQISRELFVTASTVSYHLSNIYAKVGVTSRHALADIARNEPLLFQPASQPR